MSRGEKGDDGQAVAALRDFAAMARIFDAAPLLIAIHEGADHRFIYSNTLHDQAIGGRSLIGRPLREAMPELDGQGIFEDFDTVLQTGKPVERPEFHVRLDTERNGQTLARWCRQVLQPYRNEAGETVGVISFTYDITEQVQTRHDIEKSEAALRDSKARRQRAMAAGQVGTFEYCPDAERSVWDPMTMEIFGLDSTSPVPLEKIAAIIHPDDRNRWQADVQRALDPHGDGAHRVELRVIRPVDGAERWIEVQGQTTFEDGRPIVMAGTVQDITDNVHRAEQFRAAEAAQRESRDRFRAAIDAVSGVLWTNAANGEMLGEQPGWAALTGQTYDEYQGFGWADAVHPDDAQPTINAWNEAVRERRMFVFEHRVRQPDGTYRLYDIRAIPLLDLEGEIREWVGVHTDITDRRQHEEQLRLLNRELNHRVKNLFAVVQSLIRLSAAGESDLSAFVDNLGARIEALSAAHLISMEEEELEPLLLGEIVEAILQPYEVADGPRLNIDGETVRMARRTVTPVSLVLHELATNAIKHGAWALAQGTIDLTWQAVMDGGDKPRRVLDFRWDEISPERAEPVLIGATGFGSKLIEASIAQLGGTLHRSWENGGLTISLRIPLEEES
jgi:PAS domain S-box-containing protein